MQCLLGAYTNGKVAVTTIADVELLIFCLPNGNELKCQCVGANTSLGGSFADTGCSDVIYIMLPKQSYIILVYC